MILGFGKKSDTLLLVGVARPQRLVQHEKMKAMEVDSMAFHPTEVPNCSLQFPSPNLQDLSILAMGTLSLHTLPVTIRDLITLQLVMRKWLLSLFI